MGRATVWIWVRWGEARMPSAIRQWLEQYRHPLAAIVRNKKKKINKKQ
jgi:hypothetical protein